jgi:acyl CoA:acetate/3-ketoacid CoA transferase beta subunit
MDVGPSGLTLVELAPDVSVEEVVAATDADLTVS